MDVDFDGIVFDRQALEDFYFNSTTANTPTSELRQRTLTVSAELDIFEEDQDDITNESDADDEASTLLAVSNTRPFYVDHHLQTAITREAELVNKLKKFREKWALLLLILTFVKSWYHWGLHSLANDKTVIRVF